MVQTRNLTRRYALRQGERTALDGLTLNIEAGEVFGLLGPNGAGKTTLARILTTLLLPSAGTAQIQGYDVVTESRQVRKRIGLLVGGDRGLYSRLTARQNLAYWAALQGLDGRTGRRRTGHLLDHLGLTETADERVETFSRGMVQRVHLARALLTEPAVLVMDEPTNGLDPHASLAFRNIVRQLCADGTTVLLTTHDMPEAEDLCSRVALIDHGRLLRSGTPSDLLAGLTAPRIVTALQVDPALAASLGRMPRTSVVSCDAGQVTAHVTDDIALAKVLALLAEAQVTEMSVTRPGLSDVYRAIIRDRDFAL